MTIWNIPMGSNLPSSRYDSPAPPHEHDFADIGKIALCLSVFCFSLDSVIIATAIPRITDEFHSLDDVGWYASAYLLGGCASQLIYGKLYTFYNMKWVYLIALLIFEFGSLICAVAPNSASLIVGRAIAGLGGVGIFSGALLIISKTVPLHLRPIYTSLIGAIYGIASIVAPLIGGALTDKSTWRWCFYMNLPIGGITGIFLHFFLRSPRRTVSSGACWRALLRHFDVFGTLLFVTGLVCLLLALQLGGSRYRWSDSRIIALLVLFGILSIVFIAVQIWKKENAMVPPRIFRNRNVWGSFVFHLTFGATYSIIMYFVGFLPVSMPLANTSAKLPIWFQAIKGSSPFRSGIMSLPLVITDVITVFISGPTITAFGYYGPFLLFSTIASSIGFGLFTTFQSNTGHWAWIGYQVIYGMSIGAGINVSFVVVQAALPAADIPVAIALIMFAQWLGGAVFVSVSDTIFENLLIQNLMHAVPDVSPSIVSSTGATELKHVIDPKFLPAVQVAYNSAITQTWYLAVALTALSIIGVAATDWRLSLKEEAVDAVGAAA
jgi:MFS family permease